MFKSSGNGDHSDNQELPKSVEINLLNPEGGVQSYLFWEHPLARALNMLEDNARIKTLKIRCRNLYLYHFTSEEYTQLYLLQLPKKFNHIEELSVEIYDKTSFFPPVYNPATGLELSILLTALPNIEKFTIACHTIHNHRVDFVPGREFDTSMRHVPLPKLKSCVFTTHGVDRENKPITLDPGIIGCFLGCAPQLTREAIKQNWEPNIDYDAYFKDQARGFHQIMDRRHNVPAEVALSNMQPFLTYYDQARLAAVCHPASDVNVIANKDNSATDRARFDKRFGLINA